jgi:hypothetical protein
MSSSDSRILLAMDAAIFPVSLRVILFFVLSNRETPSRSSSFYIERLKAGWEI